MRYRRVLGIYAHPDDADVGAGATIARLARDGADVKLLIVTRGEAGGFQQQGPERMARVRQAEQERAAAELGVRDVAFLEGFSDGHVREGEGLVGHIVASIRRHRPDLIVTMSPEYNFASTAANHPDHLAVGRAVVEAAYPAAGNPFDYRELLEQGLEPHHPPEVWFQGHRDNNHVVAVAAVDVERKIAAVRHHVSQFQDMGAMEDHLRRQLSRTLPEHARAQDPADAVGAEAFFRWVLEG